MVLERIQRQVPRSGWRRTGVSWHCRRRFTGYTTRPHWARYTTRGGRGPRAPSPRPRRAATTRRGSALAARGKNANGENATSARGVKPASNGTSATANSNAHAPDHRYATVPQIILRKNGKRCRDMHRRSFLRTLRLPRGTLTVLLIPYNTCVSHLLWKRQSALMKIVLKCWARMRITSSWRRTHCCIEVCRRTGPCPR